MTAPADLVPLIRLSIADPVEGGRQILALNPPMPIRWMLLAAAVAVSVVLLYLLPVATGQTEGLPAPFAMAALQLGVNLLAALLITWVGQGFGGRGSFPDALWLVGWAQVITALAFTAQILAILVLPALGFLIGVASVALSIWVLVGYICALHGFTSRVTVLAGAVMTLVIVSFLLSVILLLLGFEPPEMANV